MKIQEKKETARWLLDYIDASPTAAYAVQTSRRMLEAAGYQEFNEKERWSLNAGDRFYVIRQSSAIIAGIIGQGDLSKNGFRIIGAHTDSPGFRVKQNGFYEKSGYAQLGVEVYGGPLLASWTDRDLTLAGRIVLIENGQTISKLWRSEKVLLRIPQAAIHLNRGVNDDGLKLQKQDHLPPIIGLSENNSFSKNTILAMISDDLKVDPASIADWDLEVIDTQKGTLGGLNDEFIMSGRIDNLAMCHAAVSALLDSNSSHSATRLIALFDNEEVGSSTLNGGGSPFLLQVMERIAASTGLDRAAYLQSLASSFNISADGAHAIHPNYSSLYEPNHNVKLNGGPVIKLNAQQRYASSAESAALFRLLCREADVPVQTYIHHSNLPSGSTIGPITSTRMGIPTVDIGNAMLSMHSIRETSGTDDQWYMIRALVRFFNR